MEIRNPTPFEAAIAITLDADAAEHLVFVLKATYGVAEDGTLSVAEKQEKVRAVDEFHGKPGETSLRYAAELGAMKPATDVALIGSAIAPRRGTKQMDVAFRVGPLARQARVTGERRWSGFLWWRFAGAPKAFEAVPLTYEHACGGRDTTSKDAKQNGWDARNPVGRGYRARGPWNGSLLPQIEDPKHPLKAPGRKLPTPVGFGFIGRDWEPRLTYAGTYDEAWMEERLPLLPRDFDPRYFNAAHPDLIADGYLAGDEPVEVRGCTRSGRLAFRLPGDAPHAEARFEDAREDLPLHLETVIVDTDAMRLELVWKGDLRVHGRLPRLRYLECRRNGSAT